MCHGIGNQSKMPETIDGDEMSPWQEMLVRGAWSAGGERSIERKGRHDSIDHSRQTLVHTFCLILKRKHNILNLQFSDYIRGVAYAMNKLEF